MPHAFRFRMVDETAEGQCEGDENHENDAKTLNKHDKYPNGTFLRISLSI